MTQLFINIDRINLLDKLIRQRRTGTPDELSARLGISVSRLYVVLDELKTLGAPICYSRRLLTYYYEQEFAISIAVNIEELETSQTRHISAGQCFYTNFRPTTFFV